MASGATANGAVGAANTRTSGRIRLGAAGIASVALLVFLAVGAFFGGWELMHPAADGSGLGMPAEWIQSTPFSSWLIPGLILFMVFGIGSVVAVVAGLLRHWSAPYLTFAIGVGQMIWITVELAMVQRFHPILQPGCFALGAALAILAYVWHRQNERTA